ncbi:redoxin domain-containing protein [Candidatus Mycobacterium methanotrophicum]|uniref:Redoxin domain-containing protein n=1 Tax=Candidatus Mycobacterium methanotrophicum TaxID=2943498 RepID=A0ABY4QJ63_9MYCO|nr:redoxin domain-containing protein [Candidatus Mycobacterium methanotrophicum]UQX10532.1 redoxin domain-containing protein [Candidatus Mycobacterium methanotrophicum]
MKYSSLAAGVVAAAVLVAGCGGHSVASQPAGPAHVGAAGGGADRAVPAQLQFTAKTLDGQAFQGASLVGKPAVLWFWTPWCSTCQSEAAMVGQAAASHPAVTFVGVAGQDKVAAMKEFVDKYPVKGFTQLADTTGSIWMKFGVVEQPAFAFVRPSGGIDVVKSELAESDLNRRVTALTSP